jgi:hypothetical protein
MFDLHLCLSDSADVRYILHTQPLGLYNKILVGYLYINGYFCLPSTAPFLAYLIYSSTVWMMDLPILWKTETWRTPKQW